MSITEQERIRLHNYFEGTMGEELAPTMMACLPPAGWGDLATKQDIAGVRQEIEGLRLATKQDIEQLRVDTQKDIEVLRAEVQREFAHDREISALRYETTVTKADIGELRAEFYKMMRTQFAALVTVIPMLVVFLERI